MTNATLTGAHAAAIEYAARGWRVAPIPPGLKHPGANGWQEIATDDDDTITRWFTTPGAWSNVHTNPEPFGVCVATGQASGVFVLDIDTYAGGAESLEDLEAHYGSLPDTVEVVTGRNGRHLYFAYPAGYDITNAAAALGVGIDVRGNGGQVLAPPTLHPETGQAYEWELSGHPDDMAPADAPAWLVALLTERPAVEARRTRLNTGATSLNPERPGDRYEIENDWADLLHRDGWTLHSAPRHRDGTYELWTRPGKDPRTGASASLYYAGSDVLKVFTPNAPGLAQDATYTRFGYMAATRHGGDHSAASRELRSLYGPTLTPAPAGQATKLGTVAAAPVAPAADIDTWETATPDPLQGVHTRPPFPSHVLPEWVRAQVAQTADELQVYPDLPAMLSITALSIVAAGRADIAVQGTWTEPLNTYGVTALPPGAGKSPAFKAMLGPLDDWEAELVEAAAGEAARVAVKRRMLENRLAKAEKGDDLAAALLVQDELNDVPEVVMPRLMVEDITPEQLIVKLGEQGGRLALVSTEGGLFSMMTGRYSDRANLDAYLMAWSRDTIRVDRIGRADTVVRHPTLTIGITVQPSVIAALSENPELQGRGLVARFMFSIPPDQVGTRDLKRASTWSANVARVYGSTLVGLAHQLHAADEPATLTLAPEARTLFLDWRQGHEGRLGPDGDLRFMAEWVTKLQSTTARLAGLLHLADHNHPHTPVSALTVARAIEVGDYWEAHARTAHDLWGADPATGKARLLMEWVRRTGLAEFTVRDAHRAHHRSFAKVADMVEPLTTLVELGWLWPMFDGPLAGAARGRERRFRVHPATHGGRSFVEAHPAAVRTFAPQVGDGDTSVTDGDNPATDGDQGVTMSPMSQETHLGPLTHSLSTQGRGTPPNPVTWCQPPGTEDNPEPSPPVTDTDTSRPPPEPTPADIGAF